MCSSGDQLLIAISILISSLIDLGDPLRSSYRSDLSLASFENYKVDAMTNINSDASYIPAETTLHKMYEAAKNEVIASTIHRIRRDIIVNSLLIIL